MIKVFGKNRKFKAIFDYFQKKNIKMVEKIFKNKKEERYECYIEGKRWKIICIQQKEQKVIYNGENTLIDNRMPISLSSVNTKTIELFYCICKFPLRLIVAIFDIVFIYGL